MATIKINEIIHQQKNSQEKLEKKIRHYVGKAIADYKMIEHGDKVLVCLSGGKDSHTLLWVLNTLRKRAKIRFDLQAFTLDQKQPGFDDSNLRAYLENEKIPYEIKGEDTYSIVKEKVEPGKTYCSLCSRLRRGIIYKYAEDNGFTKIALGHHRDDLITSLLMSIFYNGEISSMPPKLRSDNGKNIVIRPLVYVQEKDISDFARLKKFPIIPCNLCGTQENLKRKEINQLIVNLAKQNPKIPSNMLHALGHVRKSQLMDKKLWDFNIFEENNHDGA